MATRKKKPEIKQQYGVRKPTGVVFAFGSREKAEEDLREDGRPDSRLVFLRYDDTTHRAVSDWQEVED